MWATLWKMDHPCFFDFFYSGHIGGDFRLRGGPFSLYRSRDTFFVLYGAIFVSRPSGIDHCSKLVL